MASQLDPVAAFLFSARSVILVISFQAAVIAGLLAAADGRFDVVSFVLVLIGFVAAHAISNLSNDYFGFRRGHDTPDSPRLRYTIHPMASGLFDSTRLFVGLGILGTAGTLIVLYFWILRGPVALAFALAGLALLYLYDAAPRPLKSLGLGEIAAFLVWGPLMVGGGYFVIAGRLSSSAFLASIPYGLGVMSILIGKHIDQAEFDRSHGQRTLPVVLGEDRARALNRTVMVTMYVMVAGLIALGRLTPFAALVAVALPRAGRALAVTAHPKPQTPPPGYIGWPLWYHRVSLLHNRLFGWAYIGGLAIGAIASTSRQVRPWLVGGVLLGTSLGMFGGFAAAAPPSAARCPLTQGDGGDPFYKPNAPVRSHVGTGFVLSGIVRSGIDCAVIQGARVEFWLRRPDGQYDDARRGTVITDGAGRYRFESNFPGGGFFRPHIHVRVAVPGYRPLVTVYLPQPGATVGTFDLVLEPEV
jgi:1,4-dihydroxy-2-naphthoate octaprenyltransferase